MKLKKRIISKLNILLLLLVFGGLILVFSDGPQAHAATTEDGGTVYVLRITTGEKGYVGNGIISVEFDNGKNSAIGEKTEITNTFFLGFESLCNGKRVFDSDLVLDNPDFSKAYTELNTFQANRLASSASGNYIAYKDTATRTLPYIASSFILRDSSAKSLPPNRTVKKISIRLTGDDSISIQKVQLYRITKMDVFSGDVNASKEIWNGGFGRERIPDWSGYLIAEYTGSEEINISKDSTYVLTPNGDSSHKLRTEIDSGKLPLHNSQNMKTIGLKFHISDILGAGIESLAASHYAEFYPLCYAHLPSIPLFESYRDTVEKNSLRALVNLMAPRKEYLSLQVTYKDVFGATRRVTLPFSTCFLMYAMTETGGKLTGGDYTTDIAGIMQRNDEVAIPIRLADYQSLKSIKLTYGSCPEGYRDLFGAKKVVNSVDTANDTLSIDSIEIYENVSSDNFNLRYDTSRLCLVPDISAAAAYHWQSPNAAGSNLGETASIFAEVGSSLKPGSLPADISRDLYLVSIKTDTLDSAGTENDINLVLHYTTIGGGKKATPSMSLSDMAQNFYGYSHREIAVSDNKAINAQYLSHIRQGATLNFTITLPDCKSIDSAELQLNGNDEWQMESISVDKIKSLNPRTGTRSGLVDDGLNGKSYTTVWLRTWDVAKKMAYAKTSIFLYEAQPGRTVNFATYNEKGELIAPPAEEKDNDYLTTIPQSLTYEQTLKEMGLSVPKFTYRVDVSVGDTEDAGSRNYFYFQLVFENGSSAVVLANKQLASDSFRKGNVESFKIQASQNYGNVKAVRIICDNTSYRGDVFDKLNVEKITVTLANNTGISKSWIASDVGWINISYREDGNQYTMEDLENVNLNSYSNDVLKEYPIKKTATAVNLLFHIATDTGSAGGDGINVLDNKLQGSYQGELTYIDSDGAEVTMTFDLLEAIKTFNGTAKNHWVFRPGHMDRFTLSLTDISSVESLTISRSGGKDSLKIKNISVKQIGGYGPVYMSSTAKEFIRDFTTAEDVATSTNSEGVLIPATYSHKFTFTDNTIDLVQDEENNSWTAKITRVPDTTSDYLNIMVRPGAPIGMEHNFSARTPDLIADVDYYASNADFVRSTFRLTEHGTYNGQNVLYGRGLKIRSLSSLLSMRLTTTSLSGTQPYIGSAIIERVKGNVIVETYYLEYSGSYLGNGPASAVPTQLKSASTPMHQTLRLQPAPEQNAVLIKETSDIAVSLCYTSTLDPAERKIVYHSPYVFLTDAGYSTVTTGSLLEIPFAVSNVHEILGINVASSGPIVTFNGAVADNYEGKPELENAKRLGGISIAEKFTTSTSTPINVLPGRMVSSPLTLSFTTGKKEQVVGAGSSGPIQLSIDYIDTNGSLQNLYIENLSSYLPEGTTPGDGSDIELTLLLPGAEYVKSLTVSAEDSWFISRACAKLQRADGKIFTTDTSVNNWASADAPLTIDMRPDAYRNIPNEGNEIRSLTVTSYCQDSKTHLSSRSDGTLQISAYPGETVTLTPELTVVGQPDMEVSWLDNGHSVYLKKEAGGKAQFTVPQSAKLSDSYTVYVSCRGDLTRAVTITITVQPREHIADAEIPKESLPEIVPESTPETVPENTSETAPESTPETAPESTPETAPESTPETAPESTPETVPESTPSAGQAVENETVSEPS